MLLKTIKSFLFFAVLQVVLYSCCSNTYDIFVHSIQVTAEDTLDEDLSEVSSENLILNLRATHGQTIADLINMSPIINSAYATSCDDDYISTNPVIAINITSNTDLFGITTGNSLNDKFNVQLGDDMVPINDIIPYLNREQNQYYYDIFPFHLNDSISNTNNVIFTFELTLEDGTTVTTDTIALNFE